jgi:serine/threonine protein kinase
MPEAALRLCPECGRRTPELLCPQDACATVIVRRYDPNVVVQSGTVVAGRYRVHDVLGRGGYGSVYAAVQLTTGQDVALKVLKPDFGGPDDATVRRFFREARVTAALSHPNTVRVFDVGQTEAGAFYIAMERLKGPSLEEVLQERFGDRKVLSEVEAIDVAAAVLRSLQEAHGRKLVHRDMKPANIVLAEFGGGETVVKLVDFGIALTHGSSLTTSGMALGTPAYMSPEQCEAIDVDGRSDLYSLGIILYRCVTGDVPFSDRNPVAIMQDHLTKPLPDVRMRSSLPLSTGFVQVLETALAKERTERFSTAQEMRQALEKAREDASPRLPSTLAKLARGNRPPSIALEPLTPRDLPEALPIAVQSETALEPSQDRDTRKAPGGIEPREPARRTQILGSAPAMGETTVREAMPALLADGSTERVAQPRPFPEHTPKP